jgi:hypothetical protein
MWKGLHQEQAQCRKFLMRQDANANANPFKSIIIIMIITVIAKHSFNSPTSFLCCPIRGLPTLALLSYGAMYVSFKKRKANGPPPLMQRENQMI